MTDLPLDSTGVLSDGRGISAPRSLLVGIALGILGIGLYLPWLGARDFWPPDEARYALVTRAGLEPGASPFVPFRNGELYPDKPPGYFLAARGFAKLFGRLDEFTVRLPSAVAGIMLLITVGVALASQGLGFALLGGTILGGFLLFGFEARQAHLDLMFAAGFALSVFLLRAGGLRKSIWLGSLGGLALGLAILTKGPHALLVIPILLVDAAASRDLRRFFAGPVFFGFVLTAALVAGWLWTAHQAEEARGAGFGARYLETLKAQWLSRVQSGDDHVKPWYTYLVRLPVNLLPFSPLLLLWFSRRVRDGVSESGRSLCRLSWIWLAVVVVALSAVAGKREIYLLVAYPAMAILLAQAADASLWAGQPWVRIWAGGLGAILAAAGGLVFFSARSPQHLEAALKRCLEWGLPHGETISNLVRSSPATVGLHLMFAGGLLLATALATLALALANAPRAALGWSGISSGLALSLTLGCLAPLWNQECSRRSAGQELGALAEGGALIAAYFHLDEGLAWYFGRVLQEVGARPEPGASRFDYDLEDDRVASREALRQWLSEGNRLAVVREKDAERFRIDIANQYEIVKTIRLGDDATVVIRPRGS